MFGANPGVVKRARDQVLVGVIGRIEEVDRTFVRAQQHLGPLLLALFLEARIQAIDRHPGGVAGRPLDAAGDAQAFAAMEDLAIARDTWVEGERGLIARRAGAVEAACVLHRRGPGIAVVETGRAIDRVEARLRPADGIVAEFEIVGLLIGRGDGRTERAVGRLVRQQTGEPRAGVLAEIVIARLRRQHAGKAGLAAQRIAGVEVDDRTQRSFVQARLCRLVDDDRVEQFRSEHVEIERAVTV